MDSGSLEGREEKNKRVLGGCKQYSGVLQGCAMV